MPEDVDPIRDPYDLNYPNITGCMLSIVGGERFGVLHGEERPENPPNVLQIVYVKVYQQVSSFLSGIETILTHLESRTASGDIVHAYTVIGTALIVESVNPASRTRRPSSSKGSFNLA